jgi:hypothetical protein
MTADFDVFVMVNNLPRENITNYVNEFWLGGGGVLSFNSALGYLYYYGMIYYDVKGDFRLFGAGFLEEWDYSFPDTINISSRHPTTKHYSQYYQITTPADTIATFDNINVPSQVGSHFTTILNSYGNGVAFAIDNPDRGGRIVQLSGNCSVIPNWQESIIMDSLDWLCPRPKGKIVYDLTHHPYLGVDSWDILATHQSSYPQFRDLMVNHTYTFDKLYPKPTGNLTTARLEKYDILILCLPEINFTSSEVTAVKSYLWSGGSLLAFGDDPTLLHFNKSNDQLNSITEESGLSIHKSLQANSPTEVDAMQYFTLEGCTDLYMISRGYVNTTGLAVGLWGLWPDFNIASSFHGSGRIILSADIGWPADSQIALLDNARFVLNAANWLTATHAEVLVYQNGIGVGNNEYRSELVNALNELGIDFMFHTEPFYFNLSLFWETWDMVIVDANSLSPVKYYDQIQNHLENGGMLIMRDFFFFELNSSTAFNLNIFQYLGFNGTGNRITGGPPIVYPWVPEHSIFNQPIDYGANNFTSNTQWFGTDFCNVTLYANATPLAGVSVTPEDNATAIILSVGGKALCNMFALTQYDDDTDDSTYPDSYELWMNEIAFMMRPRINSPPDRILESGTIDEDIFWNPGSDRPYRYTILRNGVIIDENTWNGDSIHTSLDGLDLGTFTFEVRVEDTAGYIVSDIVIVTVEDTTYPVYVDIPHHPSYGEGTDEYILNYTFTELNPDSFVLCINGTIEEYGDWDGSMISVDVGGLIEGVYNLTLTVNDTSNNVFTAMTDLTVTEAVTTTTTTTTSIQTSTTTTPPTTTTTDTTTDTGTTTPPPGDNTMIIIVAVAVVVIIIIGALKKKS